MLAEHAEQTGRRFLAYREQPARHWYPGDGIGVRLVAAGLGEAGHMHLASLHTYPIKGCRRLDHDAAGVEPWGLAGDRRWMVIDDADGVGGHPARSARSGRRPRLRVRRCAAAAR